ncbi:MAG: hypothetical protein AB1489_35590 [Acidobacteriota bacterium]
MGAALADVVLVAIISGGVTVINAAIAAFATYINTRKQRSSDKQPTLVIIVRGTEGSQQIASIGGKIDNEEIEKAIKKVGTVTEVAIGK